jgi:hypothetical protein
MSRSSTGSSPEMRRSSVVGCRSSCYLGQFAECGLREWMGPNAGTFRRIYLLV